MKKCLLCKKEFKDKEALKQHYLDFHNIDPKNYFFLKLLEEIEKTFISKKHLRCDEFIQRTKYEKLHDFLKIIRKVKLLLSKKDL